MISNILARLGLALIIAAACTSVSAQDVPPIVRSKPQCQDISAGTWLQMVEERLGSKEGISIINDKATIARAVEVYYVEGMGTPIEFDTVIMVKAPAGLVMAYAKDGKMCGLMLVLDAKMQEAVIKHVMGTGV